ncbi:MAG: sterol desaturase family protein [Lewinellaceae bacterium]|nr:sterol desaturase family protein [Lewinellaceae bacterium]MCB9355497.1 sterol desaturase family protein [Lewinellaceae bacterium]
MKIMLFAIPVFFLLIGLELLIERLKHTRLYSFPDAVANMSCGVQQQVTGVLFKTLLFTGYLWAYEHRVWTIPETWWSFVLVFIGVDFFYYWFHRSTHEISFLWGTHIVHHQSEEYNLSVALRQSAIQAFASNIFYLPLAFAGFSPASFLVMATFQTLYQFWIHTKTIGKLHPAFEYVFNTPSHHRVHHGMNPKYIDRNHGGTLILFDRWFGTFQEEEEEPVYGVTVPLNSWNPVWAQVDYYAWLAKRLWKAGSWGDRLNMLVKKPGWMPASLGGSVEAKPVSAATFHKYDKAASPGMNRYVLLQFVLLIVATFLFLSGAGNNPGLSTTNLALTGWIIWTTGSLGALLEARPWATWSEVLRWGVAGVWLFLALT